MAQKRPQNRRPAASDDASGGNKLFYVLLGLIALAGVTWLLAQRSGAFGGSVELPTPAEFEELTATVEADPASGVPLGPESAPVEIMEFVDYSCPACANLAGFAGKLLRQNYVETPNAPVRWVLYDFVLGTFPNSVPAAVAARCAGDQGRYWPMHDLLFARQTRWAGSQAPGDVFTELAREVGLEEGPFRECLSESRHLEEIVASRKYGEQLGVGQTPTVFVNGEQLNLAGVDSYRYIEAEIRARLEGGAEAGDASSDGGA